MRIILNVFGDNLTGVGLDIKYWLIFVGKIKNHFKMFNARNVENRKVEGGVKV